ncbi:LysR substrate-binding domain-containing protein [Micromonospora sp. NPDC007230]|uniref:LysR substrate-binding domain-containing protein n=1 Tax=Micromonospora sp. NPDC007230 TaxID=3364237 RepID=UPI00367EAF5D
MSRDIPSGSYPRVMEPGPPRRRPVDGSGTGCDGHPEAQQRHPGDGLHHAPELRPGQTDLTPPPTVRAHRLQTDPLALSLPDDHPLIRRQRKPSGLRLEQLRDQPWIVIIAGRAARQQFDQAAAEAGFTPRVQFETENYNVAQSLVGTGIGVAMLSRLTIAPTPGAVHRELIRPRLHRQIYAVTAADTTLTTLAARLTTLLTEVSAELARTWAAHPVAD